MLHIVFFKRQIVNIYSYEQDRYLRPNYKWDARAGRFQIVKVKDHIATRTLRHHNHEGETFIIKDSSGRQVWS